MKVGKSKSASVLVAFLVLTFAVTLVALPTVNAADIPTYAFLSVAPNPAGVGQAVSIVYWLDKVPPTASGPSGDRWQGWKIEITKPDGRIETVDLGPSDAAASGYLKYTPEQTGTYYFKLSFPGAKYNRRQYSELLQAI
ncbi:MAG: hypothetical protein QXE05_10655 [Nitrososphaeria archaeon]